VQGLPATLVVAIDGPSGSGKSTVARGVAASLGLRYLDTGAMYRALTWLALHLPAPAGPVPLDDADALGDLAETADIVLTTTPDPVHVTVAGTDVTVAIRADDVTAAVSRVSAVPAVRTAMVRRQQQTIGSGGIVVEGRDIGTTVAPDAPVKVFLTADEAVRAQRRANETAGAVAVTRQALSRRDSLDAGRAASPMAQAPDAVVVDSTDLSADEVVARIVALARSVARR
jgi:cytidylate kinase